MMDESETGLPPLMIYDVTFDLKTLRSIYGIISPIIIPLTLINNIIVVIVLYIDPKKRSPSCIQHASLAACNSLLGIFQLPVFLYFFSSGFVNKTTPTDWCRAYRIMGYAIPHLLQTASIWLMAGLALQRFLCFRYPFRAVIWYKDTYIRKLTLLSFCIAITSCAIRFFDFEIVHLGNDGDTVSNTSKFGCILQYRFGEGYQEFYHWFSLVMSHILPCICLAGFAIMLAISISINTRRRFNLAGRSHLSRRLAKQKTLKESSVLVLVGMLLIVEIPSCIVRIADVSTFYNRDTHYGEFSGSGAIVTHFLLLVSFYFYVYIYMIMNNEFRETFKNTIRKIMRFNHPEDTELTEL